MFRRKIETTINNYFNSNRDKILIIDGARQIGKSYIIRKMSKTFFKNYIEINLMDDFHNDKLFSNVSSIKDFYIQMSALYGDQLDNKDNTIIFLDEIQVYPHLLSLLKPLNLDNRYTYIASGSLLGVTLKQTFIPMGSINEARMYPMDFEEFLWANNVGKDVIEYLKDCFINLKPIEDGIHKTMLKRYKEYLLCGGLPDAVKEFVINNNVLEMRNVHELTYKYYQDVCTQYDKEHKLKTMRIYGSLISYMENKVKRIQANQIQGKNNDSFSRYEDEFDYLISSGIVNEVKAISNPRFPLDESSTKNLVKLYYNDVGILTSKLYKNNINAILNVDSGVNLGSVYETAVANELVAHGHAAFYFDSKKVGEVDYLLNDYTNLVAVPIEIKSGKNQKTFRALPKLIDQNGQYKLPYGYLFGNQNIVKKENNLITLPIYLTMFI